MKKRIRLTESDLEKLIRRAIKESDENMDTSDFEDMNQGEDMELTIDEVKNYIDKLYRQLASLSQITDRFLNDVDGIDHFSDIIKNSDLDEDEKDELVRDLEFLYDITDDLFRLVNKYF